ncbi:MAG TPA: hypothetical protein VLA17_12865, partial [Candidatus Limnocylindria bacterium]|nr:hypothetical protein [Candidatus Limnocylindria bacterium]
SKHSTDLEARKIRRVAVLSPNPALAAPAANTLLGTPVDQRTGERQAPERLATLVHTAMTVLPNWQIISDREVAEVEQSLGPTPESARLKRIGEQVYADAVMVGRVLRYRERVGDEWGAKSPASVAFVLDLVDVRRGDLIWSARFDETQKPLSENIFALGQISQRGIRWLTADQLMEDGVRKAVGQLHQIIAQKPVS